jgi:hypothetical protein
MFCRTGVGIVPLPDGPETVRPFQKLRLYRISSLARLAGSLCCHEYVTQIAENGGKNAANDNKGRRKQVAGICPNLLIPFD